MNDMYVEHTQLVRVKFITCKLRGCDVKELNFTELQMYNITSCVWKAESKSAGLSGEAVSRNSGFKVKKHFAKASHRPVEF